MLTTKEIRAATKEDLHREIGWNHDRMKDLENRSPKYGRTLLYYATLLEKRRVYGQLLIAEQARRLLD